MDLVTGLRGRLCGEVKIPGDKSISHRALLCGALAEGITEVSGFLPSEDCFSTLRCLERLGVKITACEENRLRIQGRGLKGLQQSKDILDAGNSGTTARLLLGILAGQPFLSTIDGDSSLRKRPMGRIVKPLSSMGAVFSSAHGERSEGTGAGGTSSMGVWQAEGRGSRGEIGAEIVVNARGATGTVDSSGHRLPLSVRGAALSPIEYTLPVASAQVKSAILFAGLYADGVTVVEEPIFSRDHTEKMLSYMGADLARKGRKVFIQGGSRLAGKKLEVPGDISSAAFFLVAAALLPGSELLLKNVGVNPTRTGLLDLLQQMGADLTLKSPRTVCGEPVADLLIKGEKQLKGVRIGAEIVPRLIDEIPVIAVAAACAAGETVISGAAELRVKETDRLRAITSELTKMGAKIEERSDGLVISGNSRLKGAVCESHGDHRIAMAMAVAGAVASGGETVIRGAECIDISFPGFISLYEILFQ